MAALAAAPLLACNCPPARGQNGTPPWQPTMPNYGTSAGAPYPPGVMPPQQMPTQPMPVQQWPLQQMPAQQMAPAGQSWPQQGYAPPRNGAPPFNVNPALEQLIPAFGAPLPQVPPSMAAPLQPGPGFASGWTPATPTLSATPPPLSPQEQRVGRLEQTAFGSTYPEHEVDDRIEHLEREVFGKSEAGVDMDSRIAKLESKLGGGGAFGRQHIAPPAQYQQPPPQPAYQQPPPQPAYQQPPPQPAYQQQPQPAYQQQPPQPAYQQPPQPAYQAPVVPLQAVPLRVTPQSTPPNAVPSAAGRPAHKAPATPMNPAVVAAAAKAKSAPPPATIVSPSADSNEDRQRSDFETAVQSIPSEEKAGDYFAAVQKYPGGQYAHWTTFPIRVHLPMNAPAGWKAALDGALHQWTKALPLMVAPAAEPADIEIAWTNHLQPRQLGITNLEVFNGRMRVTVYLLRPSNYPAGVGEGALPTAAVHEIGHALGLWGHSTTAGDIMQVVEPLKTKGSTVSARDINTLRRVYLAPGLPEGFQSPEPMGWPFTH